MIRHADAAHNRGATLCGGFCDLPLTELGRKQVELLRYRLLNEKELAGCYSSPLKRALETSTAAPPTLSPVLLDSLREIQAGELDGLPIDAVQARYPETWRRNLARSDDDFAWPGGETYGTFRRRALLAMDDIASRHPGQRILVFTHAGTISQVVGALAGTPPARWDLHRPANASITEVLWGRAGGELIAFDDQRHLEVPVC
ncbi:MAG TPA: histidine phosphatase family protein [Bryobacteraceae bacterium]|nr:histidine phosphatase family protein [Bryobacteraceae bacterium]